MAPPTTAPDSDRRWFWSDLVTAIRCLGGGVYASTCSIHLARKQLRPQTDNWIMSTRNNWIRIVLISERRRRRRRFYYICWPGIDKRFHPPVRNLRRRRRRASGLATGVDRGKRNRSGSAQFWLRSVTKGWRREELFPRCLRTTPRHGGGAPGGVIRGQAASRSASSRVGEVETTSRKHKRELIDTT